MTAIVARASGAELGRPSRDHTRAAACDPIRWGGRLRGALSAASSEPQRNIGARELEVLGELADLGTLALEHAETRQEVEGTAQATVSALARAIDMRQRRTP